MEKLAEGYGLIEGPVWDERRGLIFSDVLFGGVYCVDQAGGVSTVFEHRRGIGGMSLHTSGGLVVSGRNIAFKSFAGGDTIMLLDRNEEEGNVGYNDITTDGLGRIYAGSLGSSPVFDDGLDPSSGDLYLINLDGTSQVVGRDIRLTNGLAFSPDGKILYHSDTGRSNVQCYTVASDGGLGEKQVFAHLQGESPDGLAVASDGQIYVALASSGCVVVLNTDGTEAKRITIPMPMCTSVCFGGDNLSDLYIVSGSNGMDSDRAGAIFRTSLEIPGLPVSPARVLVT